MPSVQVLVDKASGVDAGKVAETAHAAVKNGIGKPDQYITVAVTLADVVLVGGKPKSALAQVDSIGGNFSGFVSEFCKGMSELGVPAENVVVTFRSVNRNEFAMNGSPLG
jgi:hypothetical protein